MVEIILHFCSYTLYILLPWKDCIPTNRTAKTHSKEIHYLILQLAQLLDHISGIHIVALGPSLSHDRISPYSGSDNLASMKAYNVLYILSTLLDLSILTHSCGN